MLDIRENVRLLDHCRFSVGGLADHFAEVRSTAQLLEALSFAEHHHLRHFVFGGGTNVLFDDAGFRGLVIRLRDGKLAVDAESSRATASAGYDLSDLVRNLAQRNLGGIEFLGNIPGSVGGAVVGNAGCYGREVADVLVGAKLYDLAAQEVVEVSPGYFAFDYRHSRLKEDPDKVVLEATLQLDPRPRELILGDLAEELEQRRQKHPHDAQCAGSFFKNPPGEKPAWQLITDAGMSTARVGRAALSSQHANFLVNEGGATSAQIIELEQSIRRAVYEHCGVNLAPEVRYVSPTGVQAP